MPVGQERQGRGDVEGFAHAHDPTQVIQLVEAGGETHGQRDGRPHEEAADDEPLAAHAVGHEAGEGRHQSVDPQEYGHQRAESLGLIQFLDVGLHGLLHRRKHLAVHVVEQGYDPQEAHDEPGI